MFGQTSLFSVPAEDVLNSTSQALTRASHYSFSRVPVPSESALAHDVNGLLPLRNAQTPPTFNFGVATTRAELPHGAPKKPLDSLNPSLALEYSSPSGTFSFDPAHASYTPISLEAGLFAQANIPAGPGGSGFKSVLSLALLPTGELLALIDYPAQVFIMIAPGVWAPYLTDLARFSFGGKNHPLRAPLGSAVAIAVSGDITLVNDTQQGGNLLVTFQGRHEVVPCNFGNLGRNTRAVLPGNEPNCFFLVEISGNVVYVTFDLTVEKDHIVAVPSFKQLVSNTSWLLSINGAAVSTNGDILTTIGPKGTLYERNTHYAHIELLGLPELITAVAFSATGDLLVMSVLTNSKRRISLIKRSVLRHFLPSAGQPSVPTLWSMDFDIKLLEVTTTGSGFKLAGTDPHPAESIISTPSGQLIVSAGLSIIWLTPQQHCNGLTSLTTLAVPSQLSFGLLRESPLGSPHAFPSDTLNTACGFSVPFVTSFLALRYPELITKKSSLEASKAFSHQGLSAIFTYIYDNAIMEPTDATPSIPTQQGVARYYAEVAMLATALEITSLAQFATFRLFALLQSNPSLGSELLGALLELQSEPLGCKDSSLLMKVSQLLATRPEFSASNAIDMLVDRFSSQPELLKAVLKLSILTGATPPLAPYCNPTTILKQQMSFTFRLEAKDGDWAVDISSSDYVLHGVPCHSAILYARWSYFRESIFPHHPTSFDFPTPSKYEQIAVKAFLRFVYTGSIDHLASSPIDTDHFGSSAVFALLADEPDFKLLLDTSNELSRKNYLALFHKALKSSRDHLELHRLRVLVAQNLPAILKESPEEFARLNPEEQYALLMIEAFIAHPSPHSEPKPAPQVVAPTPTLSSGLNFGNSFRL